MKVLTVAYGGLERTTLEDLLQSQAADRCPRISLYEEQLDSDMLDERWIRDSPGLRGRLYRQLPVPLAQAVDAFSRRNDYDALVSWGEAFGLPLAGLLKATGAATPHVALFSWISKPGKAAVLRAVRSHIHRLVVWSSVQYECAINRIGIPASRVVQLRWLVDQKFWRPQSGDTDMICAVGREMRDYPTLIEAIRDWPVRCHIAAKLDLRKQDQWRTDLQDSSRLPAHVTVGPRRFTELRELYARSRFIVIPLHPTDTDNGVTVMTEAMAMGKAVICSRVDGQRDVLEHGVNGLLVPPGDPRALRQAIEHLWSRPDECARMGAAGRARIERFHSLDRFVADVRSAVEAAVEEVAQTSINRAPRTPTARRL